MSLQPTGTVGCPWPGRSGGARAHRFHPGRQGPVRIDLFDLNGRLVRTVADFVAGDGSREVTWDGADALGRPVPGGVYFYRLCALGKELTGKVVVIRDR